jgi:gluconolactonase
VTETPVSFEAGRTANWGASPTPEGRPGEPYWDLTAPSTSRRAGTSRAQRIRARSRGSSGSSGTVELLSASIAGYTLAGPNDLAFGPDGRLWFTDSGTEEDPRAEEPAPGRLFALDSSGDGEFLMERPKVYPNGIAFDAEHRLYWTESMAHRVCRLDNGEATTFSQLSDGHVPDGMAFAADGRLFVCTTISGGVTVLSPDGEVLEEIALGEHATNCIFDGSTLYVTATRVAEIHADQRTGTFWSVETDAEGLPLLPGAL